MIAYNLLNPEKYENYIPVVVREQLEKRDRIAYWIILAIGVGCLVFWLVELAWKEPDETQENE